MEQSGAAPGLFYMSGYAHLIRALRSFRGDVRVRDPATLYKCEICPSLHARPLRVQQRRFIGSGEAGGDPLLVMATEAGMASLVSQTRVVLSGMSSDRESAAKAAAAVVLAGDAIGTPPGFSKSVRFASACDERMGRSTVREVEFKVSSLGEAGFSVELSAEGALQCVDRELKQEDLVYSRSQNRAEAEYAAFDSALSGLAWLERADSSEAMAGGKTITAEMKVAVDSAIGELRSSQQGWSLDDAVDELVDLWAYFPLDLDKPGKSLRIAQIEFVGNRLMQEVGAHEKVIELYRRKFLARFGDHLSEARIEQVPGLTPEASFLR